MTYLLSSTARLRATGKAEGVRILSFGIPAYRAASGRATCPLAGDCAAYCYGLRGSYSWSNVSSKYEERYRATFEDDFVERITAEIDRRRPDFVRVHDVGDYYSPSYLAKWIEIARNCEQVRFYSYTTSIDLLQRTPMPKNYSICYSMASKESWRVIVGERHVEIFDNVEEMERAGYTDATSNDLLSTKWFTESPNIGLVWNAAGDAKKARIARWLRD